MTGPIPAELVNLAALQYLDLGGNKFTGEWHCCRKLHELQVPGIEAALLLQSVAGTIHSALSVHKIENDQS